MAVHQTRHHDRFVVYFNHITTSQRQVIRSQGRDYAIIDLNCSGSNGARQDDLSATNHKIGHRSKLLGERWWWRWYVCLKLAQPKHLFVSSGDRREGQRQNEKY